MRTLRLLLAPLLLLSMASAPPELPYVEQDLESLYRLQAEDNDDLARYATNAQTVVVGKVITADQSEGSRENFEWITLRTEKVMRGEAPAIFDFRTVHGREDGHRDPPRLVPGYRILVFLDSSSQVVERNAIFVVVGDHAFRNRRETTFFSPLADRTWDERIDPVLLWATLPMGTVESALNNESGKERRKRRRSRSTR